ncbi:glycoside hydrolase family 6 protein [Nocardioides sp. Kera G14]|uniref:glycoside hydrolase family 6 protein n=1 Tax=Nocardioides sp. Kera G14 TaxID=2884264 RepID=UPI001D11C868|nr:glycoside hydrolase family 6 protein [Nocardioides sp. Kera G14]UDY25098.1 glycoside hydrolase family 6 protein [Nocardioides sp. Kera G14]
MRGSGRATLVAVAVVCLVVTLLGGTSAVAKQGKRLDPRLTQPGYADTHSSAAVRGGPYASLGSVPQALWLGAAPVRTVRGQLRAYVRRAAARHRTPQVVLYAIPDRDCSGGGWASPRAYLRWVRAIASVLRGRHAIAVVEPDALAMEDRCGGAARLATLRAATRILAASRTWVYLDAGHSNWLTAETAAARLRQAGISYVRGFSLNVANFRPTPEAQAYGDAVAAALGAQGIPGKHFVIDTSRNGAAPLDTQWCNPPWARVGQRPAMLRTGSLDGLLWLKHPGESDGPCNGGPASGWSDLLAGRLLGRA